VPEHQNIWREDSTHSVAIVPEPPKPEALRPKLKAARDTAAIVVDGDVSEWPWDDETRMVVVEQSTAGWPSDDPKSYACAAYDDEALYIAIRNLVRDAKRLKSEGEWGEKDAVEIPFQDVSGDRPGPILNLYGFPDGHFEKAADTPVPPDAAKKLQQAVTYAAHIGAEEWSCEWRIPWAATGIDPRQVKRLWFNIGVRKTAADAWVVWAGTGTASYMLAQAGDLILVP